MLSYRHSFHAGNFADVLKHIVLVLIIKELTNKDKGFLYLDSHSGAGKYSLHSAHAEKTSEYLDGIAKLWQQDDVPHLLLDYINIIKQYNNDELNFYPGSPLFALNLMRPQDRAILTELHPSDYTILNELISKDKRVKLYKTDGFQKIKASLPPTERRGLVFIDPPYELKEDYSKVITAISEGYKRFATGCYAMWYPVIYRQQITQLLKHLKQTKIPKILNIELAMSNDTSVKGMTSSGMIVINPPWKLVEHMQIVLPYLHDKITKKQGFSKLEWISD